jgi:hypothetical protein
VVSRCWSKPSAYDTSTRTFCTRPSTSRITNSRKPSRFSDDVSTWDSEASVASYPSWTGTRSSRSASDAISWSSAIRPTNTVETRFCTSRPRMSFGFCDATSAARFHLRESRASRTRNDRPDRQPSMKCASSRPTILREDIEPP